ncbi:NAD-dependent epimerase/dehydratase family protein [Mycolicibacterium sp. P9-64]|nr:NAD-dependent epimerase/dehydratase family protein [Mycolicibacterium sp. P9-64]
MRVFVTGATGYIGGSVAASLIARGHQVRGLVRDEQAAKQLETMNVDPVLGSLDDDDVLLAEAARADVVINAASSDHRGAIDTLAAALAGTGKTFLHTSGSSIVGTVDCGEPTEEIWDERIMDVGSTWKPHEIKASRVDLDHHVLDLGHRGVRSLVLCNSLVYGRGFGLRQDSLQVPALISYALRRGVAPMIGAGANVWSTVHIGDVCRLYTRVVEDQSAHGFYFVESGEASFADMAAAIVDRFELQGVRSLTLDEAAAEWPFNMAAFSLGSNSRVRGTRAPTELGWTPKHTAGVLHWIGCC